MSEQSPPPPPLQLSMSIPEALAPGTYADFVSLWHGPDVFTLDFAAAIQPPTPGVGEDDQPVMHLQSQVVSRVRIPPSQVFELMKALEQQLTAWEKETGRRPDDLNPNFPSAD